MPDINWEQLAAALAGLALTCAGTVKTLDEILEIWKAFGLYAVTLYYGEDIGCDDSDVPQEERRVKIIGHPVGCLGETRVLFVGTLATLREFDPRVSKPEVVNNPPAREVISRPGFYIWGAREESVRNAMSFLYRKEAPGV